jgi:hypothetical protein
LSDKIISLYSIYDLSVKVSCLITNSKYCTDETVIKEFSEDFIFFPQKIITAPNSYNGLIAIIKVIFLCGRYSSKEFWFVGFHVKNE